LVPGDHDEASSADGREPLVVRDAPHDLGKVAMAWEHDIRVVLSEGLAKREVVLVDEEPRGHGGYAASERSCSS
jgi:hypothetical protein